MAERVNPNPSGSQTTADPRELIRQTAPNVYLSEEQFSGRYNVSRRTAQRWRNTGDGPPFVRFGVRRVAYRLSDCEAWAAARTFAHRAAELTNTIAA